MERMKTALSEMKRGEEEGEDALRKRQYAQREVRVHLEEFRESARERTHVRSGVVES